MLFERERESLCCVQEQVASTLKVKSSQVVCWRRVTERPWQSLMRKELSFHMACTAQDKRPKERDLPLIVGQGEAMCLRMQAV